MSKFKVIKSPESPVLNEVQHIQDNLKTNVRLRKEAQQDEPSSNCCFKLLSCLKKTNDSIPKAYKEITFWLMLLAAKQADTQLNEPVLRSALLATLHFATKDQAGSQFYSEELVKLIQDLADEYQLDLNLSADYPQLLEYCQLHDIEIPPAILEVIDEPAPSNQASIH